MAHVHNSLNRNVSKLRMMKINLQIIQLLENPKTLLNLKNIIHKFLENKFL